MKSWSIMKRKYGSEQVSERMISEVKAQVPNPYFKYWLIWLIKHHFRVFECWNIHSWCNNISERHLFTEFSILFADQELLFWSEKIIHEDCKWINAWQLICLHLFAYQLKQMVVAVVLLFPVTTTQLSTAKFWKSVS